MDALRIIKNLFRVATVSSVNYQAGKVRVTFKDKENTTSGEIPMMAFEYMMPEPGDSVFCIFLGTGTSQGVCIGKFFSQMVKPVEWGKKLYYKHFWNESYLKYDSQTKTFTISAQNIRLMGDVTITGNLTVEGSTRINQGLIVDSDVKVDGNIHAEGNITAVGSITPSVPTEKPF